MTTAEPTDHARIEAEIFARLAAPFDPSELRTRDGTKARDGKPGKRLTYITPRTARRRLNEVLGPANWDCEVEAGPTAVRCSLTITLPTGRKITRAALGGYPEMPKTEDIPKGGDSDAFKRAAAMFGVAEYLHGEDVYTGEPHHAPAQTAPANPGPPVKSRNAWGSGGNGAAAPQEPRAGGQPRTGSALWARLREYESQYKRGKGVTRHILQWGESQGWPGRIANWDFDQVKAGEAEARSYIRGEVHAR
jgi:hypothetical protein